MSRQLIDLSHKIEDGMITYRGLPAPHICDYWTREASAANYDDGSSFQIGEITLVANTGTYLDAPSHRFADGADLSQLELGTLAGLPGVLVRAPEAVLAIDESYFQGLDLAGKAVLVHTGWNRHWRTEAYFENHPYLTATAADYLAEAGVRLVGIDSYNIDNTAERRRPVHTRLLKDGIPICEHLTNLDQLPENQPFRFTAVPPKIVGMRTFPVRAFAEILS